jgi:hypothetical protein
MLVQMIGIASKLPHSWQRAVKQLAKSCKAAAKEKSDHVIIMGAAAL